LIRAQYVAEVAFRPLDEALAAVASSTK
jgi:hypothetical protein